MKYIRWFTALHRKGKEPWPNPLIKLFGVCLHKALRRFLFSNLSKLKSMKKMLLSGPCHDDGFIPKRLHCKQLIVLLVLFCGMQASAKIPSGTDFETGFKQGRPVQIRVTGTVTDDNGSRLSGASVVIKGTSKGTTTTSEGKYALDVDAADILVFSMVGYENREIAVGNKTVIDIQLSPAASSLDQVVVVGYGTTRKRDLTGSVGSVKMSDFQKAPVKSFEEALAGRLAGVTASADDGQPGASVNIVIRGNNSITQDNSPLYVVDGFPLENPDNNALNPAEIESIEVLKDASSTAIYGARGANGVIVITTKKGKIGKPVITYNGYIGFQQNTKKVDLLSPYEFVKLQSEIDSLNADSTFLANGKTFEDYRNFKGVDLQDSIFQTTPFRNHFVSLTGGNGDTRYSISGSALNQTGILTNSGYDRYQGRIRLDQRVSSSLNVGINANYSNMKQYGTSPAQDGNGFYYGNLLFSVWAFRPITGNLSQPEDVDEDDDTFLALQGFNPLKTARNALRRRLSDVLTTDAYAEYSFAKNFKLRVTGGMSKTKRRSEVFNNTQTPTGSPLTKAGADNGVNGSLIYNEITNWVNENTLTFNRQISKASLLNTVVGFTLSGNKISSYGASANHIPNEDLGISGIDEGTPVAVTSTSSAYKLASFLGRVNYTLLSKYLFTASFRADGSSKFASENKWSYFPSAAVAWRLSDEAFMRPLKFVSNAKLRFSYGSTGNNRVSDYAYLSRISLPSNIGYSYYNDPVVAAVLTELGNRNLKWETTNQTDIGLDLGFLDQKITLEADVYRKVTSNLLLDASLPGSMGFSSALKNIGKVQNQGLELTLNTANVRNKSFSWSSNFNISFNRNEVLALSDGETERFTTASWDTYTTNVPLYVAEVGHPIARFWGYQWDGNYQYSDFDETSPGVYTLKPGVVTYTATASNHIQPGNIKFKDITGDGKVDASDRTIIGNPNPDFTGGFTNNFSYKNFDLSVFFAFSYGNDVINVNRIIMEGGRVRQNQNYFATYANRWTPENQSNEYFRLNGGGPLDFAYSTRVIEDGSYLKLKTLQLGFNFPQKLIRRIKLSNLRLYASAQKLWTLTYYSGFDPEVSKFGSSALRPAFDYSVYPHARTITFGLNVSF